MSLCEEQQPGADTQHLGAPAGQAVPVPSTACLGCLCRAVWVLCHRPSGAAWHGDIQRVHRVQLRSTGCLQAVSPREMTALWVPKLMVTAGALSAGRCAAALGAQEGQGQSQQGGGTAGAVLPGHASAGTVLGVLSYPKMTAASQVSETICGDSKSLPECLSQERRQAAPGSGCRCPRRAHWEAGGGAGLSCHQHPAESRTRAGLVVGGVLWALPPPPCSNF